MYRVASFVLLMTFGIVTVASATKWEWWKEEPQPFSQPDGYVIAVGREKFLSIKRGDGLEFQSDLDKGDVPEALLEEFENKEITLSKNIVVSVQEKGSKWLIDDRDNKQAFTIRKVEDGLNINKLEVVQSSDVVDALRGGKEIRLRYVKIEEDIEFYDEIKQDVYFIDTIFSSQVCFGGNNTKFSGEAYFKNATFSKEADFSLAKFIGRADFSDAKFYDGAYFAFATLSSEADFSGAKFSGRNIDFSDAIFSGSADFSSATFSSGWIYFGDATFSKEANFSYAKFVDSAHFSDAIFSESVDFSDATFSGGAKFDNCQFKGTSDFRDFIGCLYPEKCKMNFNDVTAFSKMLIWWKPDKRRLFSMGLEFQGILDEHRVSKLKEEFEKNGIDFDNEIDFEISIQGKSNRWLITGTWDKYLISKDEDRLNVYSFRDGLRDHLVYDETFYIALIKNYKDMGWFPQADDTYYTYRVEKRERLDRYEERPVNPWYKRIGEYIVLDFPFGYGVKPWKLLRFFLILWIPFSFYYAGFLYHKDKEEDFHKLKGSFYFRTYDKLKALMGIMLFPQNIDALNFYNKQLSNKLFFKLRDCSVPVRICLFIYLCLRRAWNPFHHEYRYFVWGFIHSLNTITPGIDLHSLTDPLLEEDLFTFYHKSKWVIWGERVQQIFGWYLIALFLILFGKIWIR